MQKSKEQVSVAIRDQQIRMPSSAIKSHMDENDGVRIATATPKNSIIAALNLSYFEQHTNGQSQTGIRVNCLFRNENAPTYSA